MRAILFDLGDTLFRLNPLDDALVRARFAAIVGERLGVSIEAATEVAESVHRQFGEHWRSSYRAGSMLEPAIREIVSPWLAEHGEHGSHLADQLDRIFGEADTARWIETAGRADELARFAASGLKLAFVSNTQTQPELMRARLTEFGLLDHAHVHVFSVAVGERKPSPAIYRAALEGLGISPQEALFVGDRVREDVIGPQSLGMRAVLTHEFRQEDPGEAVPHGIIRSIAELWDLLD